MVRTFRHDARGAYRIPLAIFVTAIFTLSTPLVAAGPGDDHSQYGSKPGDPLALEDAEACLGLVGERDGISCNVLYGHIFDLLNAVPINVQRPPDDAEDMQRGFAAPVGAEKLWDYNQLTLFSSPGFVEYPENGEDPRLHPERGITKDVHVPADVPIIGYWYLSADYDEVPGMDHMPGTEGPDVGFMPCMTVRMTLQEGRYFGQGAPLAVGETTKHVLSAADADKSPTAGSDPVAEDAPCPDAGSADIMVPERVSEFEVVLEPVADHVMIPSHEGFLVHVEWYQYAPGNPDEPEKFYQTEYNLRTGPEHRARVVVPVQDAIDIDDLQIVPFDGLHYVRVLANSPWGSYDIDQSSFDIQVLDPSGAPVELAHLGEPKISGGVDHGEHFAPIAATYPWDLKAEALPEGEYTVRATVRNWQHTATATYEVPLVVKGEQITVDDQRVDDVDTVEAEQSPAPAALPLGVLGLAALSGLRKLRRDR